MSQMMEEVTSRMGKVGSGRVEVTTGTRQGDEVVPVDCGLETGSGGSD